ncbi:MAG: tRNA (N6-threonylcarbamoyladenosine(37)-N6)-methyltransferase TrmO [Proteobacteria bacterium]|nr:MAG: tRNA (N6-threonylcarbamoyladenosine(37)-N6)-methyltransferase TrmO [Pseudomonadota bacterium]
MEDNKKNKKRETDFLTDFTAEPIGVVRSCFTEKFGIPRQSGLAPSASAVIQLRKRFCRQEIVNGLDGFNHLWVLFIFHRVLEDGWKTTVRPPRLGGRERVGVFATRSPHRPNHIGLSAVRLDGIQCGRGFLHLAVSGGDLLDGTPVIDLKPYIPYSDVINSAHMPSGAGVSPVTEVLFTEAAQLFCQHYEEQTNRKLHALIIEVLRQDPRPASQQQKKKEFGIQLWNVNVRWEIDDHYCRVLCCELLEDFSPVQNPE